MMYFGLLDKDLEDIGLLDLEDIEKCVILWGWCWIYIIHN